MKIEDKSYITFVYILALVTILYRIYLVPSYPVHEDELISFKVLKSISETGLPKIGELYYWRSLVGYYVMSVPLFFLGFSEYSARLVPIVCSGLILPFLYSLASACGSRIAGLVAVVFLAFSSYEGVMANFSRFYMPFQFFFTITIFLTVKYFSKKPSNLGPVLFFSILLTFGTHRLAVQVLVFFVLYVVAKKRFDLFRSYKFFFGCLVFAVFVWVNWRWRPGNVTSAPLSLPVIAGALEDKWFFYDLINRFLPFGWFLIFTGLYPAFISERRDWFYLWVGFVVNFILFTFVAPSSAERYMTHLFPVAVLLAALSLTWWIKAAYASIAAKENQLKSFAFFVLILFLMLPWNFNNLSANNIVTSIGWSITYPDQKEAHDFIRERLRDGDIVVSCDPDLTKYFLYLDNVYFVREKYDVEKKEFRRFDNSQNPYLLDSPAKLRTLLLNNKNRIWLYANWKIEKSISVEMDRLIRAAFRPMFSKRETYVLLRP